MTDRNRLIELIKDLAPDLVAKCPDCCDDCTHGDCVGKLADHLLANGVIVPPCKVGDTVYRIVEMGTGIRYRQVGRYECGYTKGYEIARCTEKIKRFIRLCAVTKNNFFDVCENFGKTVFLTKEEAEAKLKEINNAT